MGKFILADDNFLKEIRKKFFMKIIFHEIAKSLTKSKKMQELFKNGI